MKNLIIILLIAIPAISFSQKAGIDCPPKTKLRKDVSLGYLNFRGARLGEIYTVKFRRDKIKRMTPFGQKGVDSSNIDKSPLTALKQHKIKIDFTLNTSADMSPALKAQLKSELNKEMDFRLFNSRTKMIKDPFAQISYIDPNIFPIKSGEVYALINRVTVADSLVVVTDTGLDIDANAKVKLGQYDVEIVNNCSGILRIKGLQVPAFFEFRVFEANVTSTVKAVIGAQKEGTQEFAKIKQVTWTELTDIELEEGYEL